MASLITLIVNNYNEVLKSGKDPMVDKWPLMGSPGPVLCIVVTYLIFVLKAGPKMMEKRPAFQLNTILILYNAFQVIFSIWLTALFGQINIEDFLFSHRYNSSLQEMILRCTWWYFIAKITELLDTVFFVLRKKQNQVTFLHVYHHSTMVAFTWCYLKLLPSQQGIIVGFLNSMVHVIMYSYYFIAALGHEYRKYLWWKKYMTWIQLIQFGTLLSYLTLILYVDYEAPKSISYFFLINGAFLTYLFIDFYRTSYKTKKV